MKRVADDGGRVGWFSRRAEQRPTEPERGGLMKGHMLVITNDRGDYVWSCGCGAESRGSWHGDRLCAVRGAVKDARANGHLGGVAFAGFSLPYAETMHVVKSWR